MLMRMLEAGGFPVLCDGVRKPDADNPGGYYELERVKALPEDSSWIGLAEGKAVKVVSLLLYHLPSDRRYRILFMRRKMEEILASQEAMLRRQGASPVLPVAEMERHCQVHLETLGRWLEQQRNLEVLHCDYHRILRDPRAEAVRMARFLGAELDTVRMAAVVDPSLHHHRK
jgi:hypothetical protein